MPALAWQRQRPPRHVPFEDLGTFHAALTSDGFNVNYLDAGSTVSGNYMQSRMTPYRTWRSDRCYETEKYPLLLQELDLMRRCLATGRPTLGICLGGQLTASDMRAAVSATGWKEIVLRRQTRAATGHSLLGATSSQCCSILKSTRLRGSIGS